jgi:hypothetical protein
MRDIVHEQVSQSTDQQLADRLAVLIARSGGRGCPVCGSTEKTLRMTLGTWA